MMPAMIPAMIRCVQAPDMSQMTLAKTGQAA
jgi:hypothetical protein